VNSHINLGFLSKTGSSEKNFEETCGIQIYMLLLNA